MAYEFKKLSDVDAIESMGETANILVEEDGVIKKVSGSAVGGSGGGVTSWNDLQDKPFGNIVEKYYIEEMQLDYTINDSSRFSLYHSEVAPFIEVGKTYVVIWNGVEYSFVAVNNVNGIPALGDINETGEYEFRIEARPYEDFIRIYNNLYPDVSNVTLSVYSREVDAIPNEFLPEHLNFGGMKSEEKYLIKWKIKMDEYWSGGVNAYIDSHFERPQLTVGEEYYVDFGDTSSTCVAKEYDDMIYLGNRHLYNDSAEDTGESFYIHVHPTADTYIMYANGVADRYYTIKISGISQEIVPLDKKYISGMPGLSLMTDVCVANAYYEYLDVTNTDSDNKFHAIKKDNYLYWYCGYDNSYNNVYGRLALQYTSNMKYEWGIEYCTVADENVTYTFQPFSFSS